MTMFVLAAAVVGAAFLAGSATLFVEEQRRPKYVGRHRAMF
jgi:outer membrane murein-binding lipoprotein Lpp